MVSQGHTREMWWFCVVVPDLWHIVWKIFLLSVFQLQMDRWGAVDKGLKGQILCKASSKIDFRSTAVGLQWTVRVFLCACVCVKLYRCAVKVHLSLQTLSQWYNTVGSVPAFEPAWADTSDCGPVRQFVFVCSSVCVCSDKEGKHGQTWATKWRLSPYYSISWYCKKNSNCSVQLQNKTTGEM